MGADAERPVELRRRRGVQGRRRASASPGCRTAASARATTRRSSTSASRRRCSSGSTTASRRSADLHERPCGPLHHRAGVPPADRRHEQRQPGAPADDARRRRRRVRAQRAQPGRHHRTQRQPDRWPGRQSPATAATASATSAPPAPTAAARHPSSRTPPATSRSATARGRVDVVASTATSASDHERRRPGGGTVPATLSLTLGAPATLRRVHAGDHADLHRLDPGERDLDRRRRDADRQRPEHESPGHLVNGAFSLPQPVKAAGAALPAVVKTYSGPVTNDSAAVEFSSSSTRPTRCAPARTPRR